VAGAAPAYAFGLEPNWLEVKRNAIRLPDRNLGTGVRILQLSDFHASRVVPFQLIEKAVDLGLATKPDLICLTGDFVTDSEPVDFTEYARILRRLPGAAPTFACLGNHDGGRWIGRLGGFRDTSVVCGLLDSAGITLLHNRSELLDVRGQSIRLAGVPDLWSHEVDGRRTFQGIQRGEATVLLAHNPDTKDALASHPWDLMLSGHTHGGQVVLPLVGAHFVPVRDKRFIAGLKAWNCRQVYVSRGVGNVGGVRVNCRPEVTIVDLTA